VLKNGHGAVHITGWDEDRIAIEAEIRVKAAGRSEAARILREIVFTTARRGDTLEVFAVAPRIYQSMLLLYGFGERTAVRIRYRVRAPRGTAIACEAVGGDLELHGVGGRFSLETGSGSISIESPGGEGFARTGNGAIRCVLGELATGGKLELAATNGDVECTIPERIDASFDVTAAGGRIRIPASLEGSFESKRSRAAGMVGDGTGAVLIRAKNGDVKIATMH
jgi:hypothetical protein